MILIKLLFYWDKELKMSLPTKAIFTMKGEEVFKGFANIGWIYDEDFIPRLFYDMMCLKQFPKAGTSWDEVRTNMRI